MIDISKISIVGKLLIVVVSIICVLVKDSKKGFGFYFLVI